MALFLKSVNASGLRGKSEMFDDYFRHILTALRPRATRADRFCRELAVGCRLFPAAWPFGNILGGKPGNGSRARTLLSRDRGARRWRRKFDSLRVDGRRSCG
jgi:hypothetical protein